MSSQTNNLLSTLSIIAPSPSSPLPSLFSFSLLTLLSLVSHHLFASSPLFYLLPLFLSLIVSSRLFFPVLFAHCVSSLHLTPLSFPLFLSSPLLHPQKLTGASQWSISKLRAPDTTRTHTQFSLCSSSVRVREN